MEKSKSDDCGRIQSLLTEAKTLAVNECSELMVMGARDTSERMAAVVGCIHEALRNLDRAHTTEDA